MFHSHSFSKRTQNTRQYGLVSWTPSSSSLEFKHRLSPSQHPLRPWITNTDLRFHPPPRQKILPQEVDTPVTIETYWPQFNLIWNPVRQLQESFPLLMKHIFSVCKSLFSQNSYLFLSKTKCFFFYFVWFMGGTNSSLTNRFERFRMYSIYRIQRIMD